MVNNIGVIDRILRVIVALVIVALYAANAITGWAALVLVLVAMAMAGTAVVGWCPLYSALGISTRRRELSRT
jgi:hypothetical protein